jgi:hypothetical protein
MKGNGALLAFIETSNTRRFGGVVDKGDVRMVLLDLSIVLGVITALVVVMLTAKWHQESLQS